jgi:sRNA-binding regulator protein Hfq
MGYLKGFAEARERINGTTLFDHVVESEEPWSLLASQGIHHTGIIRSHTPYMFVLDTDGVEQEMHKHEVELLCPEVFAPVMRPLFDVDPQVQAMRIGPVLDVSQRAPLRNTMLYVCHVDKLPVEITVLSGYRFRGVLTDFTRYEMRVSFTPKLSLIVLRHAIHSMYTQDDVNLCNPNQNETRMKTTSSVWVDQ